MANQSFETSPIADDEIDLIDVLHILLRRKRIILGTVATVTLATLAYALILPDKYTATSTLMPIEKASAPNLASALSAMGGSLGLLANQTALSSGAADKFIVLMKTRTMSESIIRKHNLLQILFEGDRYLEGNTGNSAALALPWQKPSKQPSMQDASEKLSKLVNFSTEKLGSMVTVSVTHQDPELAARIANAYVEELSGYLQSNSLSTAKRNRVFIEKQLQKVEVEMASHEARLKDFQKTNGVVSLDAQTEASVRTYSDLKSKLITAEIELGVLRKSTFDDSPATALKEQEIQELRDQLVKFESDSNQGHTISFSRAPNLNLSYARIKRDLMVNEKLFELLTQQYQMARIQEAQDDISFQVLDQAISPEKKSGPKRSYIFLIGLIGSLGLGVLAAFSREFWVRSKAFINKNYAG